MSSPLDYAVGAIAIGEPVALGEGVECIRLPLPFPPRHVNVYRLPTAAGALLVDTGYANEETARAWAAVGMPPAARVLVTHFHPDHVGQAAHLEEAGVEVHMPAAELTRARALRELGGDELQDSLLAFFAAHALAVPAGGLGAGNGYRRAVPALPRAARPVDAGPLDFDAACRVRIAGGHSPAHALVVHTQAGAVAAGDILLPTISPNVSVWPDQPDADPLGAYLDALESLRDLPEDVLVLPAHGLPYRGVHARIEALAAHHAERLDLVRDLAARRPGLSAADVLGKMFDADLAAASLPFALGESIAHLNRLWHAGELERTRGRDGVYRFAP